MEPRQPTRACIFCGDRASTKEDAWPLWLVRKYPDPVGVEVEAHRRSDPPKQWRQRGHFAKVRFVCQPCNNGWMSLLEEQAKPIIERLMANSEERLDGEERHLLA